MYKVYISAILFSSYATTWFLCCSVKNRYVVTVSSMKEHESKLNFLFSDGSDKHSLEFHWFSFGCGVSFWFHVNKQQYSLKNSYFIDTRFIISLV